MLLGNEQHAANTDYQGFGSGSKGPAELVGWAIGLLRRQYLVILFVAALCLGVGFIYLSLATPIYTAQTSIYIELHRSPIGEQAGLFGNDPIEIDSQIEIIKSKPIARAVIQKLRLTDDPKLKQAKPAPGIVSHLFEFVFGESSAVKSTADSDPSALDREVAGFGAGLTVDRVPGSRVISINYSSASPDLAAGIANAIASAYIADQLEAKYQATRVAGSWLQERQKQLRDQLDAAQRAVEAFKKQNNIVTADGKPLDDKQVTDLNSRIVAARAQTADIKARLDRLDSIVQLGPSNFDGALSEINNQIVLNLRQQYLELARREAEWSARYGSSHLAVVNLRNRMQEIRQSMFDELKRTAQTAKNDYELAKQRQADLESQLSTAVAQSRTTDQSQAILTGLESTAASYRSLYDNFVQHYMGATQDTTFPITEARVISPATPPLQKSKPKSIVVLAFSLLGGLGIGFGLAFLRDSMDRVFRTTNQLEEALQLPCIGLVPLVEDEKTKKPFGGSEAIWTVVNAPLSSFAEAIRSIKLAVDLHSDSPACKVIGFTSTLPGEGKSTLAASLAQLVSQAGGRALLVDCDLRNPTLSRTLASHATAGIVDVISRRYALADAIVKEPKTKVSILPAGKSIPLFLSSDILGGEGMSKLFEVLREKYDYIIVDLPPLAPIVDVRASTRLIDSYLLTVAWGRTHIDAVEHALKGAPKVYDRLIGVILNKTDMSSMKSYDNTGSYYYNKDFARYGYTE